MSVRIPVDILRHFLQLVLHQVCFHKILEVLIFLCLPPRICIQLRLILWPSKPNHQVRVHQEIVVKQIHEIFQIMLLRIRYHQDLNQFNNSTIPIIFSNHNNNYIHHNLTKILQLIKTVNSNYLIQIFSQVIETRVWFDEKKIYFENTLISNKD